MLAANETQILSESDSWFDHMRPWLVCLSAALFFFYEFIQMHMFNSISPGLMKEFSIDAASLGTMSSTYLLADVLFLLPAGLILDRFSTRRVIMVSMSMCIFGTVGFAVSHTFWLASAFHFVSGVGNAFCFLSCILLTTQWFPAERRALVIGVIVTMAMTGGIVAQWPLAMLSGTFGWRHALAIDALLGVAIIGIIWLFVEDHPVSEVKRVNNTMPLSFKGFMDGLKQAMSRRQNWLAGFYTSFLNLPIMLLGAVYGDMYLQQVHHYSLTQATTATEMLFLGTIIGSPVVGWLSDNLKKRRMPMIIGAVLSTIVLGFLIYVPYQSFTAAIISFFLLGLFTSTQVLAYPLVAESNPRLNTATAMALTSALIMGGATIAQPLFGYLMQWHWNHTIVNSVPYYSAGNYRHGLLFILATFLIALFASFKIKETSCRPYPDVDAVEEAVDVHA